MKRIISFISLLALCLTLYAGSPNPKNPEAIDSLRQEVMKQRGEKKSKALGDLVSLYYSEGDAEAALATLDEQIAYEQELGRTEEEGNTRWRKIAILNNFSRTEELLKETDIQMEWFLKHELWERYYPTWQRKANVICGQGKIQLALQEAQNMLKDAQARDNKIGRAMAYKQMGVIYLDMKQAEQAIGALKRSANLLKEDGNETGTLSNVYYRLTKAYDLVKDYNNELQAANDWLLFLNKLADKKGEKAVYGPYNTCYLAQAAAHIGLEEYDEARQSLKQAERYTRLSNSTLSRRHFYTMKARYYLAKGSAANALVYTDSVRMLSTEEEDLPNEIRAQALVQLGRGAEAARLYQQLYHQKDSTFGREARQHLDELNTLLQVDEIKTEEERTRFRYTLLAVSSIVVALLALLVIGWRFNIRLSKTNGELRIANERAKVSSNMKTEFIRNVSHEIRTPLNIISGFTQILTSQKEAPSNELLTDIQQRISENTDRITKLVDRMLELSDANSETVIERNDQTAVLHLIVKAIDHSRIELHTYQGKKTSDVVFESNCDEAIGSMIIRTNIQYAVRALSQLLENARKFTSKGKIVLKTECSEDMFRFIVEDTGIGIPADQTEHIFDEFVQLDAFADGTGIGLTVARSLARRMGGDIRLDTTYTQGARFILELPRN